MSHPTSRFLPRVTLLTAAAVAVCAWPWWAWAGRAGLLALLGAAGIVWLGALAGHAPRALLARRPRPEGPLLAAMAGIGTRMLTTVVLALPVIWTSALPRLPFAAALLALYALGLVLEVRDALAHVREPAGGPGPLEGATTR